jgi:hypothetical protein
MGFLEDWKRFLEENWSWFLPLVATMTAPLMATGVSILYDYVKTKGWV